MATGATDTSQENGLQSEEFIIDIRRVEDPNWGPECCIYKVPKRLCDVKKEAYTPKLISIGPVHHYKDELKDMQMVISKRSFLGLKARRSLHASLKKTKIKSAPVMHQRFLHATKMKISCKWFYWILSLSLNSS